MQLNPGQHKAATTLSGPVLVLAGAGAGKTATLTRRIINLIESGAHPQSILAITFTNKAAKEMRERVLGAMRDNPKMNFPVFEYGMVPWVGTFHSLGVMIIKEQHQKVGIKKHFAIYDRDDARRAVKEAVKRCDLDPKQWDTKKVLGLISKNKGNFVSLDDFKQSGSDSYYTDNLIDIWKEYEAIKKHDHALDFDDLLLESAKLLKNDPEVKKLYQTRFAHIHVDEYQDTNKVQYQIVRMLINSETQNIFVVGDPDQLIYSWRGAEVRNIMKFEKDFPSAEVVLLEQNYRSTKTIIAGSNAVIAENKNRFDKNLFTENTEGEPISLYSAYDAREEANWIGKELKSIINDQTETGVKPSQIAVLYRANFQSRLLEEACLKNDIPYQVLGTKFFDRAEVKDILSYIKSAFNPEALVDVRRVINTPRRGIGKVSLVKILSGDESGLSAKVKNELDSFRTILTDIKEFAEQYSPSETVAFTIERSGLESMYRESGKDEDLERLANMFELVAVAEKYDGLPKEEAMEKFLEEIALAGDQDSKDDSRECVKLMTIHASKGLEFDTVFLTGVEEDMFTPQPNMDRKAVEDKAEEERRLFYVAMTRAEKKLYFSWANMRDVFGSTTVNLLCNFVTDIPGSLLVEEESIAQSTFGSGNFSKRFGNYDGIDDDSSDGEEVIEYLNW